MKKILLSTVLFLFARSSEATIITVTNANASGAGSLVHAIDTANLNPGNDSIIFDIPGMPPHVIPLAVASSITVTESLLIDGTSQPDNGYTGSCPKIVPDASTVDPGLVTLINLNSQNVFIFGLWIRNFTNANSSAIVISDQNNKIGEPGKKNLFTGNVDNIQLVAGNTEINSNYFGCDCDGNLPEPNSGYGIFSFSAIDDLTILNNVISSNSIGILLGLGNTPCSNVIIQGNKIGTNASGTSALGNSGSGMELRYMQNLVFGGSGAAEGNVVSGNGGVGCLLLSCSGTVHGNKIGTDLSGNDTIPNDPFNINYNSALNCNGLTGVSCSLMIGGNAPGESNVICGNNIALNIADYSGYYEVTNNVIGQTLSGLSVPTQTSGIQLVYDTNVVRFERNYIHGSNVGVRAYTCRNFIFDGNVIGLDFNGNDLAVSSGYSMNDVDSFTIQNDTIRNCVQGIIIIDCNNGFISTNSIQDCQTPIVMRTSASSCHHNLMDRNAIAFNTYSVDLRTGNPDAANDDIMPPVIEGSTADSTWGSSLPNALINLCKDTTLSPTDPQGFDYSIPQITADASGHWAYLGALANPNDYTAMQTDVNNNSSQFAMRLTLGVNSSVKNSLRIYPVPASEKLFLENLSGMEWKQWKLFNSIGELVSEGTIAGETRQQIDVKQLSAGYYFMKVISGKESFVIKCMKD